jgi:hypothetical protein
MEPAQHCPICNTAVPPSERYPRYVCESCRRRVQDERGRPLTFSNESFSGGFVAIDPDTHEKSDNHICYVDGIKCWADEAHMGGIVIRTYDDPAVRYLER